MSCKWSPTKIFVFTVMLPLVGSFINEPGALIDPLVIEGAKALNTTPQRLQEYIVLDSHIAKSIYLKTKEVQKDLSRCNLERTMSEKNVKFPDEEMKWKEEERKLKKEWKEEVDK